MVGVLEGFILLNFWCLFLRTFKVSKDLGNKSTKFSVWLVMKHRPPLWDELLLELTTWLNATTFWLVVLWQYKSLRWLTKPIRFLSYINVDNAATSSYIKNWFCLVWFCFILFWNGIYFTLDCSVGEVMTASSNNFPIG